MFNEEHVRLTEAQDFMLYVIPGYKCNLRCDYCFVPKYDTQKMSHEVIHAAARFLKWHIKTKRLFVSILWWEPFLYFETVLDTIRIISKEVPEVSFCINTNGNLIKESQLIQIRDTGAKVILIMSIDGESSAMSVRLNGNNEQVDHQSTRIYDIFLKAKEILWRENTEITMTISKHHMKDFAKNLWFLISLNPGLIRYRLASGDRWNVPLIKLYLQALKKWFPIYIFHKAKNDKATFPVIEQFEKDFVKSKYVASDTRFYPCSKWINLTLTPEWRFVPCYNFLEHKDQHEYGYSENILDYGTEKFHEDLFLKWRNKSYNLNNQLEKEDGTFLESKLNYSTCLTKNFNESDFATMQKAMVLKDNWEKEIWEMTRKFFQEKYNIDITSLF